MRNRNRHMRKADLMAEINITPFTDVVLVLLIIFMVTTPLILQSGIKLTLPKATAAEVESDKSVVISINSAGEIFLNDRRTSIEDLKSEISLQLMSRPDAPVIVKGDRDVRYDSVIRVIDAAKQSGAKRFALSVELKR